MYIFWTRWVSHAYLNIRWSQVVRVTKVVWGKTHNQSTILLKPLYLKNSDIQTSEDKKLLENDLNIDPIMRLIGDDLHCLQFDRNLWRIYLQKLESRNKLLTRHRNQRRFCFFLRHNSVFFGSNFSVSKNTHMWSTIIRPRICRSWNVK